MYIVILVFLICSCSYWQYLPKTYFDRNFVRLKCQLQLFQLLLQFHDPVLCKTQNATNKQINLEFYRLDHYANMFSDNFLNQFGIRPDLYATSWYNTSSHVTLS